MRKENTHYDAGGIETIDILRAKLTEDQYIGFLLGSIIKYTARCNFKGCRAQDIRKASEYSRWLSEALEKQKQNDAQRAFISGVA